VELRPIRKDHYVRSLPVALAVTIAVGAAAMPSAASAATGWKLPTLHSNNSGVQITVKASHCGKSKFGTWTFRQHLVVEGKVANVRMRVKLTKDGKPHRGTGIRVSGTAPASAKAAMKASLRAQKTRYVAGSPAKLEAIASDGHTLSTRVFKPRHTKHC
jgi:hypothetical protein